MGSLRAKLSREIGTAIADYGMIEAGDTVAVAVSGGKDSLTLLDILVNIRRRAGVRFDIVAVTVDQGYEGFRWPVMEKHFRSLGVPYHIENTRISDVIEDHKTPGSTWCALCGRLRRGVLYRLAGEKGWSKIALGHHADDLIETNLLSQLFNGATQSMPPILRAKDGRNVVIRPMCYVWERQVIAYTEERKFPVICCACPACRDLTLKRQRVKALLQELEETWPGVKRSLLSAQRNLKLTQMMDPRFLPLGRDAALAPAAGPAAGARDGGAWEADGDGIERPHVPGDEAPREDGSSLLAIHAARRSSHVSGDTASSGPVPGGPRSEAPGAPGSSPRGRTSPPPVAVADRHPGRDCGAMCGCGPTLGGSAAGPA